MVSPHDCSRPCNWLQRHWSNDPSGICQLCQIDRGDLEHFLYSCPTLEENRKFLFDWWRTSSAENDSLGRLIHMKIHSDSETFLRFVLDASSDPDAIQACQLGYFDMDSIFKLTRTYCYSIHHRRLKLMKETNQT